MFDHGINANLIASLKASILQLEIEIAKAELMVTDAAVDGQLRTGAEERLQRLRLDLQESRHNLRAAEEADGKAE